MIVEHYEIDDVLVYRRNIPRPSVLHIWSVVSVWRPPELLAARDQEQTLAGECQGDVGGQGEEDGHTTYLAASVLSI